MSCTCDKFNRDKQCYAVPHPREGLCGYLAPVRIIAIFVSILCVLSPFSHAVDISVRPTELWSCPLENGVPSRLRVRLSQRGELAIVALVAERNSEKQSLIGARMSASGELRVATCRIEDTLDEICMSDTVAFASSGKQIRPTVVVSRGALYAWDDGAASARKCLSFFGGGVEAVDVIPGTDYVVIASRGFDTAEIMKGADNPGNIRVFDHLTSTTNCKFTHPGGDVVRKVCCSADGMTIVTLSNTVRVWSFDKVLATVRCEREISVMDGDLHDCWVVGRRGEVIGVVLGEHGRLVDSVLEATDGNSLNTEGLVSHRIARNRAILTVFDADDSFLSAGDGFLVFRNGRMQSIDVLSLSGELKFRIDNCVGPVSLTSDGAHIAAWDFLSRRIRVFTVDM